MKSAYLLLFVFTFISCGKSKQQPVLDIAKHEGLMQLETNYVFQTLYSEGEINHAEKQSILVNEAYQFLSEIMGPKDNFCVLVVAPQDWTRNAYSPVVGMPEYYRGNLIVGAGQNHMASGYQEMIQSFPKDMTQDLVSTYTNANGQLDMRLFFDKLVIHELTHSFQDPENQENYSMSRWLEEIHANMGLYAFYKTKKPKELKYVMELVDFSLKNPPPDLSYTSLLDFDRHYYEMNPANYGQYQMRFTQTAKQLIDSLGNDILKPLNDFLIKYDDSWKGKMSEEDFGNRLSTEVDPYFLKIMHDW
ncbi:hypothetical protein [Aquimarina spongiae]|uniref:hypothetical protein n=1 Tax=Aquimarina spongiae TaxID=570521 RepID=UPI000933CB8C|nr:hypothetical protein [Aquimarina spongiae]